MTRFWWVRHAVVPSGGKLYGQSDPSADCSDTASFAGLAALLPEDAAWVATPLQRTQQTAQAIWAQRPGAAPGFDRIEPALMEQHFGEWQGRSHADIHALFPEAERRFWIAPARHAPPGGESFADLHARTAPAIHRLAADYAGRDVVVVAHGGTIRAALGTALGLEVEAMLAFAVFNLSVARIDHFPPEEAGAETESWRVTTVNMPPRANAPDWRV